VARGALLALALCACGGVSLGPGQAQVTGTIDGATLKARSALSVIVFSSSDDGASAQVLLVELGDRADDCASATYSASFHPDEQVLGFALSSTLASGKSVPPTAGTYGVVTGGVAAGNAALVSYARTDDHCGMLAGAPSAMSGTVTLEATTSTGAQGRFDLTLTSGGGEGSHVEGAFDSIDCPAIALPASNPAGAGCM
jgi:hypothetical protein